MSWLTRGLQFLAGITVAALAHAGPVTANFDDIDASGGDVPIASPYLGFTWANFTAYTATPGFEGFNNGIVSPANAAYSGGEMFTNAVTPIVGSITSTNLFDFLSADLGAGYYDGLSLTAQGLRGGQLLFTRTVTLGTTGAQGFSFDFIDIDTLTLVAAATPTTADPFACGGFNCTQFTLDDVMLVAKDIVAPPPEPPAGEVSEPGSLALVLVAGLGAAGLRPALRRRRTRR